MGRKLPLLPTIVVVLAVATMLGLGVWQLRRAVWKEALLTRFAAAQGLPPIAYPVVPTDDPSLFFRRASGFCVEPVSFSVVNGRNVDEDVGWSHRAQCRAGGGEGPGMVVDIGWSAAFDDPVSYRGGPVEGVIVPDGEALIRLVSARPAPGLQASQPPGPDTIANNHRLYAAQWFFFAGLAALIYWLALRRRGIKAKA